MGWAGLLSSMSLLPTWHSALGQAVLYHEKNFLHERSLASFSNVNYQGEPFVHVCLDRFEVNIPIEKGRRHVVEQSDT